MNPARARTQHDHPAEARGRQEQALHDAVLADLEALGPFFAVNGHQEGTQPRPPWRPAIDLITVPEVMAGRIAAVRQALAERGGSPAATVGLKVAASVTQMGLVARLLAPALAGMAAGHQLSMEPRELWWQDALGGPVPLSIPLPADHPIGRARSHEDACRRLIADVIEPVTTKAAQLGAVSQRVLWGNVASAVNGAALQVAGQERALARAAWKAAETFFLCPELAGERDRPGPRFRRSSCCLIYRVGGPGPRAVCGDCVLSATT